MKYNNPITFFCPIAVPYFSLPYLPRYNTLKFIYGIGTCDQMVKLFFNIWLFATTKTNPVMKQICQIRNKPSKNCQRLVKFCQSGEISPNLVTLLVSLFLLFLFVCVLYSAKRCAFSKYAAFSNFNCSSLSLSKKSRQNSRQKQFRISTK